MVRSLLLLPVAALLGAASHAADAAGAASAVRAYYASIAAGRYAAAWRLRWESDRAGAAGAEAFARGFSAYRSYHATIGPPSRPQAAASSFYVEVPVQIVGRLKNGKPFATAGTVTVRRAQGSSGATAAQRKWRIYGR